MNSIAEYFPRLRLRELIFIIYFFSFSQAVLSQEFNYLDAPRASYGVLFGFMSNRHIAEINGLTNVPDCCPKFTEATGNGFSLGLSGYLPLGNLLGVGLRLGVHSSNASFTNRVKTDLRTDTTKFGGFYEHNLDAYFKSISLTPTLSFSFIKNFKITFGTTAEYILTNSFEQNEKVVDNSTYFLDGTQSRNNTTGSIGDINKLQANIFTSLAYKVPLNQKKTILITPEIFYSAPTISVVKNADWKINSFGFGLALEYSIEPEKSVIIAPEPLRVKKENMKGSIALLGIDDSLNEIINPIIRIEEFETTTTYPLLNYIFFDEDSNYIPSKYNRLSSYESKTFSIDSLFGLDNIDMYYHILNIIGKRMQNHTLATITLTGYNQDKRNEANNTPLSRRRASEIGSYLEDVWGINTNRIKIIAKNLPENPCIDKSKFCDADNRRVEIISGTPEILAPVVIHDTLLQITPKEIKFITEANCEEGLQDWFVEVRQFPDIKKLTNKADTTSDLNWVISEDSVLLNKPQNLVKTAINYLMRFRDNKGDTAVTPTGVINVNYVSLEQKRKQEIQDYKTDRYMILFNSNDFILDYNKIEFLNYIRANISKNSTVTITSQTDTLGNSDENLLLSNKRALAVARALKQKPTVAKGLGKITTTFNNELPEGRFYSRNTSIVVETPIK